MYFYLHTRIIFYGSSTGHSAVNAAIIVSLSNFLTCLSSKQIHSGRPYKMTYSLVYNKRGSRGAARAAKSLRWRV